jgi:hypothetical protein
MGCRFVPVAPSHQNGGVPNTEYRMQGLPVELARTLEELDQSVVRALPSASPTARTVVVVDEIETDVEVDAGAEQVRVGRAFVERTLRQPEGSARLTEALADCRLRSLLGRTALDGEQVARRIAAVFGPRFTAEDVRRAIMPGDWWSSDPSAGAGGEGAPPDVDEADRGVDYSAKRTKMVLDQVNSQLGLARGVRVDEVLVQAWKMHLDGDERSHLATVLAPVLDEVLGYERSEDLELARQSLAVPHRGRGWKRAPVERDHVGHLGGHDRVRRLAEHPEGVADAGSAPHQPINDLKDELFAIMQVLGNVVNDDMRRFVEEGGELDAMDLHKVWPLTAASSSLSDPRWARAVSRAVDLMGRTSSAQHKNALGSQSSVQAVLDDIAPGYSAILGQQPMVEAIEQVVLAEDPFVTADELKEIVLRSKAVVVQQAGLNVVGLNAARAALSVPADSEGTYEPISTSVHPSNLRFDPKRRKVVLRKPVAELAVPKSAPVYQRVWLDADGTDLDVTVGDAVRDAMGSTIVLACPGLMPVDRAKPAPLLDQWERLVERNAERWTLQRPDIEMSEVPEDLRQVVDSEVAIDEVVLHDLPGARVEVRRGGGKFWIACEPDALAGAHFSLDGGVLRVTGDPVEAVDAVASHGEAPRLVVHLDGRASGAMLRSEGVAHLVVGNMVTAEIAVPDDGTAYVEAVTARVDLGSSADAVIVSPDAWPNAPISVTGPGDASASLTVMSLGDAHPLDVSRGMDVEVESFARERTAKNNWQWEVSVDHLPEGARRVLDSAPAWVRDRTLDLPDAVVAARNNLARRVEKVERRFVEDRRNGMAAHQNRVMGVLLEAARGQPAFLSAMHMLATQKDVAAPSKNMT